MNWAHKLWNEWLNEDLVSADEWSTHIIDQLVVLSAQAYIVERALEMFAQMTQIERVNKRARHESKH